MLQKDYQEALQGQASGEYNQVMEIFSHLRSVAQNCQIDGQSGAWDLYSAKVLVVVSAEQLKDIIDQKLRDYTSFKATRAYRELERRVEKENRRNTDVP